MAWSKPWGDNMGSTNQYTYANIYTKDEIDNLLNEGDWKKSVETFEDIKTTYPTPEKGWVVPVDSTQVIYRYNGTSWVALFGNSNSIELVTPITNGLMRAVDKKKFDELVSLAPESLDTLKEIADSLGNDPNFSQTINNKILEKVDKVAGKDLSTNDYTNEEKNKLAGISDNADKVEKSLTNGNILVNDIEVNVYTHPDNHPATMIEEDSEHRFATDDEKNDWNSKLSADEKNIPNGIAILNENGEVVDYNGNKMVTDPTKFKQSSNVVQSGLNSNAEGSDSKAIGDNSHAEGFNNLASGLNSHAEGSDNVVSGENSHAEGSMNSAVTSFAHTKGRYNLSSNGMYFNVVSSNNTLKTLTLDKVIGLSVGKKVDVKINNKKVLLDIEIINITDLVITLDTTESLINVAGVILRYAKNQRPTYAEGENNIASGNYSHAEGSNNIASGNYSHAESYNNIASGDNAHAEGTSNVASGSASHAEGSGNIAATSLAHAKGENNLSSNGVYYKVVSSDNTLKKLTLDNVDSLSVGKKVDVKINNAKALLDIEITNITDLVITLNTNSTLTNATGVILKISQGPTYTEGSNNIASGNYSHAEGSGNVASGKNSHAECTMNSVSGDYSHVEGFSNIVTGLASHAEGSNNIASGLNSHAEGKGTAASGTYSHSEGEGTKSNTYASHAMGVFNKTMIGSNSYSGTADAFVIGNGNSTARSNAFRVTFDGKAYGQAAFNSTGADYAEYFEWLDGNINNEDRVGYFVTLDGSKIRKANSSDEYILGVVSVNPSVVGDSHQDDWNNKYLTDDWGRIQYEWIDIPEVIENEEIIIQKAQYDEEGKEVSPPVYEMREIIIQEARRDYVPKLNPVWDHNTEYIPREKRPEWSPVGIVGKLLVYDDGTCEVNGYCKPKDSGIATASLDGGYRVMERVSDDIIKIFIK